MTQLTLTPHERQELKGRAHRLNPVVLLGAGGLTEAVFKEVDRALNTHGLIKIKVPGDERAAREDIFVQLAERLSAARVQSIGKILVLYRPLPDAPPPPPTRSPQAPARPPARAAGGATTAQRGKPGRGEIRAERPSAPRRKAVGG
jgi:putative YhbY family RNA-binding protein